MSVSVADTTTRPAITRLQDFRRPARPRDAVGLWWYGSRTITGDASAGNSLLTWTVPTRDATAFQWTVDLLTVISSATHNLGFDMQLGMLQVIDGDGGLRIPTMNLADTTVSDGTGTRVLRIVEPLGRLRIAPQATGVFQFALFMANTNGQTDLFNLAGRLYTRDAPVQ